MMDCDSVYVNGVCNASHSEWHSDLQINSTAHKRKRHENGSCTTESNGSRDLCLRSPASSFVQIVPDKGIFQSEKWKPNGSTLYYPVSTHLLVNFEKYDQISFDEGLFFIGDSSGGCLQKEQGHVIHCWRFDEKEKVLFIAMSFLFTNFCAFQDVVSRLTRA